MMMFFHGGYNETILFEGWTIDSIGRAALSFILSKF
jgi:Ctr copper transporter family